MGALATKAGSVGVGIAGLRGTPHIKGIPSQGKGLISDADRKAVERPLISRYAYQCPESLEMTSCANQWPGAGSHRRQRVRTRARAYGMAGSIPPDCHKLKYCHLVAQILARLASPAGVRSSAHLLPRNRHAIASATGATSRHHLAREGRHHLAREGGHHLARPRVRVKNCHAQVRVKNWQPRVGITNPRSPVGITNWRAPVGITNPGARVGVTNRRARVGITQGPHE